MDKTSQTSKQRLQSSKIVAKRKYKLPKKAKFLSDYKPEQQIAKEAIHDKKTLTIFAKKTNNKKYIFLPNPSNRTISEISAFNGLCQRLMIGKQHPKTYPTYNGKGDRTGYLSEYIEGFTTLSSKPIKTFEEAKKFVPIWVSAYVEDEADLTNYNYGIDNKGNPKKIDDDRSSWPLVSKYAGFDPDTDDDIYKVAPAKAHRVSREDIKYFPKLSTTHLIRWCTDKECISSFPDFFRERDVKEKQTFFLFQQAIEDIKYQYFLKRILIPDEAYVAIAKATISSPKQQNKFASYKAKKTRELKNVLLNMPEFQDFIKRNPYVIDTITSEFKEYNQDYKNSKNVANYKYQDLRIDIEVIKKNFAEVQTLCFDDGKYTATEVPEPVIPYDNLDDSHFEPEKIDEPKIETNTLVTAPIVNTPITNTETVLVDNRSFFTKHPNVSGFLLGLGIEIFFAGIVAISLITAPVSVPLLTGIGLTVGIALTFGIVGAGSNNPELPDIKSPERKATNATTSLMNNAEIHKKFGTNSESLSPKKDSKQEQTSTDITDTINEFIEYANELASENHPQTPRHN